MARLRDQRVSSKYDFCISYSLDGFIAMKRLTDATSAEKMHKWL
jgi:hypothetical protein